MSREEHEHAMPDEELLQKLSDEYQEALLADDKMRIENNIAPRFWQRFGRYYHAYSVEWKDPHPTTPVTRHLSESALGEVEMEWMDQVLRGEIELGDESRRGRPIARVHSKSQIPSTKSQIVKCSKDSTGYRTARFILSL